MKKTAKVLSFIFVFALVLSLFSIVAFAADNGVMLTSASSGKVYVADDANLLTASERNTLENKLGEMSEALKCDIIIHTTNGTDGKSIVAYSDDYFDYNGYGYGKNRDGIILVRDTVGPDYYISTRGLGIKALDDYDLDQILDDIYPYIRSGNYNTAFNMYADFCESEVKDATKFPILAVVIGVVAGFLLSSIPLKKHKDELKSVKMQRSAANYARNGSFNVSLQNDLFMYSNTTRVRIETDSGRGGSTHTSSSGASHGGGGRHG